MTINPATYHTLIGIIVILSAVLIGIIFSYFLSLKRLSKLEKKETEIVNAAQEKAAQIIAQATQIHDTSATTLEHAVGNLEKNEEQMLATKTQEAIDMFTQKINEFSVNNIKEFNNISETINQTMNLHYEELRKLLSQQTVESQKLAEDKVKQEYDVLEKQLAAYKQEQIVKINKNIYQILLSVSKSVFGSRLDMKGHEEMIIQALAEAEKEIEHNQI